MTEHVQRFVYVCNAYLCTLPQRTGSEFCSKRDPNEPNCLCTNPEELCDCCKEAIKKFHKHVFGGSKAIAPTTLPVDSEARKELPLYRGLLRYFPAALALVANISKRGNDKHNPGEPMHHARAKSVDHADCILRHLIDLEADYGKGVGRDENGVAQVGYIVWRALALAQEWLETNEGKPLAPGAKL